MKELTIIGLICFFLIGCSGRKSTNENGYNDKMQNNIITSIDLENWTKIPHVSGRLSTEMDVNNGAATFLIDGQEKEQKPLDIEIPALAFHVDQETNEKTPVIVIQGEQVGEDQVIGIKYLDGTDGICLLIELEFVDSLSELQK